MNQPAEVQKVSVVIPAYNEEAAIGEDIEDVRRAMKDAGYDYEILVVNDGSKDRTAEIAGQHGATVINHHENKGVGAARKTGIKKAAGEIIVMLDGDGTYPPRHIPEILSYMDRCDMCVGDRSREAGTMKILRGTAKWIIRHIASYITGKKIYDLNSGMRAFYKETAMKYFNILPAGHSWVSTITIAYLASGMTVKYIPIDYNPRKGKSTFHPLSDTLQYLGLVFRTVMYFNPLKVFVPLALIFFGGGAAKLIWEGPIQNGPIKESTIILITFGGLIGVMGLLADLIVKINRPQ
mgnify:CR=1 FL=1